MNHQVRQREMVPVDVCLRGKRQQRNVRLKSTGTGIVFSEEGTCNDYIDGGGQSSAHALHVRATCMLQPPYLSGSRREA